MKKFILLAALSVIIAGVAYSSPLEIRKGEGFSRYKSFGKDFVIDGKARELSSGERNHFQSPLKSAPLTDIIYYAEGTTKMYDKNAAGTWVYGDAPSLYMDVFPANIVWGDNGDVYFKDILSVMQTGSYVKGRVEGDKIIVPANQTVVYDEDFDEGINLGVFKTEVFTENGQEYFTLVYDESVENICFSIGEDGKLTLDLPGEPFDGENITEYSIGFYYTEDYSWTGYADFWQEYTQLELEMVTIPSGVETEQYVYVDEYNLASIVDVAFVGNELYIRGLSNQLPEGTIRATIDGDKAYVDQNEYLGVYFDMFYIFTKILLDNPAYDPEDPYSEEAPYIFAPESMKYGLILENDRKIIRSADPDIVLCFHSDPDDIYNYLSLFQDFELKYQSSFEGVPSNPVEVEYQTQWADWQGFNDLFFTLSNFSTEGNLLNTDYLYYSVLLDGELLVFEEEETIDLIGETVITYQGVPSPQIYMPYKFSNDIDISKWSDNIFDVGIYVDGLTTVGVQAVYFYENVLTASDIVTYNVETGETTVTPGNSFVGKVGDKEVVSTEYYDLNGVRVNNPGKGIDVKRTVNSDGSYNIRKVIVK